ncbi:MAG: hypothetical protein ACK4N5_13445 [Myxococcales bacterium]
MLNRIAIFTALCALSLTGCNGPKEDCEGSFKSYQSLLEGQSWSGIYELLTPEFKRKIKVEAYEQLMKEEWGPTHSFKWDVQNVGASAKVCIVNGNMKYTWKVRGKNPEDRDEYFAFTFRKQPDGKWYMEHPGDEKIGGF